MWMRMVCVRVELKQNMNERCGLTLAKNWPDYLISGTDTISEIKNFLQKDPSQKEQILLALTYSRFTALKTWRPCSSRYQKGEQKKQSLRVA
jgi:hypothetical protein